MIELDLCTLPVGGRVKCRLGVLLPVLSSPKLCTSVLLRTYSIVIATTGVTIVLLHAVEEVRSWLT